MGDDEHWARFGQSAGTNEAVGRDDGSLQHNEEAESGRNTEPELETDLGQEASLPWWAQRAAQWAQQGWSEEEIWEFLLDRTEGRESEDWWPDRDDRYSQDSAALEKWSRNGRSRGDRGWEVASWWQERHGLSRDQWRDTAHDEEDPWAAAAAKRRRSSGMFELGSGAGEHSDKPTEKIPVPSFAGHAGEEGEIGSAARSYLRKVEAWVTRLPEHHRGVALYSALKERAWVEAEALDLDRLSSGSGVAYFKTWVRERFMDIEVTQVGRIMSQFFRVLRRGNDQSVRSFTGDFDRMVARLSEVQVTLPENVLAWMFIDKLRLDESGEISLLASVRNEYKLKVLQEAALIHDRSSRKPWEESKATRPKARGVHFTANDPTDSESDFDLEVGEGEDDGACVVSEETAQELHSTYLAHLNAKSKYREAVKGRGFSDEQAKAKAAARLKLAKERSFCSACKKKGHWHKDPECPLNKAPKTANFTQVHGVFVVEVLAATAMVEQGPLAIIDTGCASTVVGYPWFERYMAEAEARGVEYIFEEDTECFKFGASRVYRADFAVWLPVCLGGSWVAIRASVVPCDVPFLVGRPAMKKLGARIDLGKECVDLCSLKAAEVPLVQAQGGRPAVAVFPEGHSKAPKIPWSTVKDEGRGPGIWHNDLGETACAYMAACSAVVCPEREARPERLFYAKRLPPAIEDMLAHSTLNVERDFWVERGDKLIRVHVVPRKYPFSPEGWQTEMSELKAELLRVLGEEVVEERIPCRGPQLLSRESRSWKLQPARAQPHALWIGRSVFQRHCENTAANPNTSEVNVVATRAMGHVQGRPGERARGVRGGRAPGLDHQRGARDGQGAADGEDEQRGASSQRAREDDPAAADGGGPQVRTGAAGEADQGSAHQADPRRQGSPERHSAEFRALSGGLQPSAGAVPGLGPERMAQLAQLQRRSGTAGTVVGGKEEHQGGKAESSGAAGGRPREDSHDTATNEHRRETDGKGEQQPGPHRVDRSISGDAGEPLAEPAETTGDRDQGGHPERAGRAEGPHGVPPRACGKDGGRREEQKGEGDGSPEGQPVGRATPRAPAVRAFILEGPVKENLKKQAKKLKRVLETSHEVYKKARQQGDGEGEDRSCPREPQDEEKPTLYLIGGPPDYKEAAAENGVQTLAAHAVIDENRLAGWDPEAAAIAGPDLMWAELPFGPWTPRRGRSYKQHKEKMKSERRLLRQVLEALENQAACGKGAVFAHPASSYVWETPSVQKWESLSEHQVLYYKNAREDTKMKAILSGCAPPPGGDSGELTAEEVFAKALQETGKRKRKGYHEAWAVEAEPPNIDEEPGDEPELREAGAKCITFDQRVPKAVQGALRKLHQNLGHPPNSELARHIRLSGGSSEAVKACKTLRCRTCQACARPYSARPSKPVPALDFNEVLGLDLIFLKDSLHQSHVALSMVDYASTFHVVKDRTAKTLAETVRDHWVSWAGPPHTFALDLDSGFKSVFDEMCYEFGSFMSHAAGTAHWQHGLVERHSGAWKSIWERTVDSAMVVEHEVAWTIAEVSNAKNQLRNKDGYSPRQWVFGANPRLPGDVFDDENNLAAMSHYTVDARMQRQNAIRQAARIAFMRVQTDQAMQRALLHRSRVKKTHYEPGDLVFIFRQKKPERDKKPVKMWVGPCTVIGNEGQNLWVSKGGRCLLCAPEHLRPAEAEEISELLRVRAAMDDVQAIIDEDKALRAAFAPEDEELIPDDGGNQAEGKDTDDIAEELLTGEGEAFQEKFVEMENMDWDDGAERRRRCLDDLPHCPVVRGRAKKARTGEAQGTAKRRRRTQNSQWPRRFSSARSPRRRRAEKNRWKARSPGLP